MNFHGAGKNILLFDNGKTKTNFTQIMNSNAVVGPLKGGSFKLATKLIMPNLRNKHMRLLPEPLFAYLPILAMLGVKYSIFTSNIHEHKV